MVLGPSCVQQGCVVTTSPLHGGTTHHSYFFMYILGMAGRCLDNKARSTCIFGIIPSSRPHSHQFWIEDQSFWFSLAQIAAKSDSSQVNDVLHLPKRKNNIPSPPSHLFKQYRINVESKKILKSEETQRNSKT